MRLGMEQMHAQNTDDGQWMRQANRGMRRDEKECVGGYTSCMIGVFTWSWASTASGLAQTSINTRSQVRSAGMTEAIV